MSGVGILWAHRINKMLPLGYKVDHDPAICTLRRPDGTVVAYYPIWGIEPVEILLEAQADVSQEVLWRQ